MTSSELADYFLRRLYQLAEAEGHDRLHSLNELALEVGTDDKAKVMSVAKALEDEGMIQAAHTFGGSDARITGRGSMTVEEVRDSVSVQAVPAPPTFYGDASYLGLDDLLHDRVRDSAFQQWSDGHLRDAVLNAVITVFDLIRELTGLDLDGERLITRTFSERRPLLVVSDLETVSGRNEQVGFMQLLQGTYRGIRSPKAHTLRHDLNRQSAAQYLVLASYLARRVDEARRPDQEDRSSGPV